MKSIILTAQNVRDLHSRNSLSIEKTSPERPYNEGDVLYIREPWYRLKDTEGNDTGRFNYAANATAEPVAYKWASPVAMPAAAIRYYARVVSISETCDPCDKWTIILEELDERLAKAADAGVPIANYAEPGESSTYFTYAGDMTPEDYKKMTDAIDADRERLEQIRARRREISLELGAGVANKLHADELSQELDVLGFEEAELVASLESAGVPVEPSDEEKEKLTEEAFDKLAEIADNERKQEIETRLAEITARLETIADIIDSPDQFTADAIEEAVTERDELTEEAELLKRELDPDAYAAPAEVDDDEEVGSFMLGSCKYCGRDWGVTLEGSKSGGYPTQRTADAAATRVCDCAEAVENRAPIMGVALAVTVGACRYCGQMQEVGPHPSQAHADETASEVCNCPKARSERRVHEQIEDARDRVQRLFGEGAESLDFRPVSDEAVGLLDHVVEMIARGPISSASINIRGQCKAKFSVTSKGKIKVSRSETRSCDLEAGE